MELKIDKRLEEEFPPLSTEAFNQLEENILKEGVMEKLIVWNGTIVDGHNRYKICRKHNIPFEVTEKDFPNIDEAIIWAIAHQLGRRNMPEIERIEKALKREDMIREQAKSNSLSNLKRGPDVIERSTRGDGKGTRQKLADLAGTSPAKIQRVKKIREEGEPEVYEKVKRGEISIWDGYQQTRGKANQPKPAQLKTEPTKPKGGDISIEAIRAYAAELKKPLPSTGSGNKIQNVDPIITDLTEIIKSFVTEVAEYQYISTKVSPELKTLIEQTIARLNNIKSKIKEK